MKLQFSALLLSLAALSAGAGAGIPLVDLSGSVNRQLPTDLSAAGGVVVAVVSSPGTPSPTGSDGDDGAYLSVSGDSDSGSRRLCCRGATLGAATAGERLSLCATSLMAGAIVLEGIAPGDVEQGLRHSRHARTLTALMRAKMLLDDAGRRQRLVLGVMSGDVDEAEVKKEVQAIFDAVAAEMKQKASLSDMYDLFVVSLQTEAEAQEVLASAQDAAMEQAGDASLSAMLAEAQARIRESGVASGALDSPLVAQAFLTCRQAYAKHAKASRARAAAWKARASRGLLVDGFGEHAEALLKKTLGSFDSETLAGAGLAAVSAYRLETRTRLQAVLEASLEDLFNLQVSNLEKYTLKKLSRQLLSQLTNTPESNVDDNAAAMRNAAFAFETGIETLQIPSLNLVKDKAITGMTNKLTDALSAFPDGPEAQLKRAGAIKKTTSKERKPTQRAVDLGLDLVAMIRPDGFGSLQGFAGYQLGGNSVTVGVANDADDPQVIAQMGGVRPPLIRIQPKLRVDVEL